LILRAQPQKLIVFEWLRIVIKNDHSCRLHPVRNAIIPSKLILAFQRSSGVNSADSFATAICIQFICAFSAGGEIRARGAVRRLEQSNTIMKRATHTRAHGKQRRASEKEAAGSCVWSHYYVALLCTAASSTLSVSLRACVYVCAPP
jgi:hypothetical protein